MPRWPHLAFSLLLVAAATGPSWAGKLDVRARTALAHLRAGGASIEATRLRGASIDRSGALQAFITGPVSRGELERAGARIRTALPGLFTASIPADAVDRVAALPGVTAIRGGAPCTPELDVSVPSTGATLLRGAGPSFIGLNGQGVIVGIVDSGIDHDHEDFDGPGGTTRILSLWDQVAPGVGIPGYPYGVFYSSAQIDGGTCPAADSLEHGTHIAGIAAGDGSRTGGSTPAHTYAGMAPRTDLVIVKTDFLTPDVVDAISYVFNQATLRGANAVVNLSLGTQSGPHDGGSLFEQSISALVGPGRIVVKSAGNERGQPVHAQVNATAGGAAATLSAAGSAVGRYFGVDAYYNTSERLQVRITTPNGTVIGPLALNTENAAWPGQSTLNGVVYVSHDSLDAQHRNIYLEVFCEQASKPFNGTWTITLLADELGAANGEVDLWRHLVAPGVTASFVTGNAPGQELVSEPGNAVDVITVGAWVSRDGWTGCNGVATGYAGMPPVGALAPFSSPGPTRDGRVKPDLVAPGTAIASASTFDIAHPCPAPPTGSPFLPDDMSHRMLAGTSMAAPHVTGAVALLLQKFGPWSPQQVLTYLGAHARTDGLTGIAPSPDWGHGKLDLGDLLDPTATLLSPNGGDLAIIGTTLQVTWNATDQLGSVTAVDLELSRAGAGGPWEPVATGIANTGSFDWTITGPPTAFRAAWMRVRAHDTNANAGLDLSDSAFTIGDPLGVDDARPPAFALDAVSPNPMSRHAVIRWSLAHGARVRLAVRDVQGREVAVLADGSLPAGPHAATWDRADPGGTPAGIYFVCLETPAGRFVRRLTLLR
jgi:subtilisin family serine protease